MGRWDESTRKKNLNKEIEKKILRWNNFLMNPPNRILKYFFLIITFPTTLVHQNSRCSKFVQKHIIILTPLEYIVIMSAIIFTMIFLFDLIPSQELRTVLYIVVYILVLFFGMARSGGGRKRKKDEPPTDDKGDEIIVKDNLYNMSKKTHTL